MHHSPASPAFSDGADSSVFRSATFPVLVGCNARGAEQHWGEVASPGAPVGLAGFSSDCAVRRQLPGAWPNVFGSKRWLSPTSAFGLFAKARRPHGFWNPSVVALGQAAWISEVRPPVRNLVIFDGFGEAG